VKNMKRVLAVVALGALVCMAPFAFSSPRLTAEEARSVFANDQHYKGVCGDCSWRGTVYDRRAPAEEECQDHTDALAHSTFVVIIKE
jgi:hypothetical protein